MCTKGDRVEDGAMMSWDSMEMECGWVGRLGFPDHDFLGDFHDTEDGMWYAEAVNGMPMEESEDSPMFEGKVDNNADESIPTSNRDCGTLARGGRQTRTRSGGGEHASTEQALRTHCGTHCAPSKNPGRIRRVRSRGAAAAAACAPSEEWCRCN